MLGYILPIKKQWCEQIFNDQRKYFEFRRHFDQSFKGRCFIYESGKDGCHKVIGFFDTERIAFVEPGKLVPEDFDRLLDSIPEEKVEEVLTIGETCYCIPILHPMRFTRPMTLSEFSEIYRLEKKFTAPPQSRARIYYDHIVECGTEPVEIIHYRDNVKKPFL